MHMMEVNMSAHHNIVQIEYYMQCLDDYLLLDVYIRFANDKDEALVQQFIFDFRFRIIGFY